MIALVIATLSVGVSAYGSFSFHFKPPITSAFNHSPAAATNGALSPWVQLAGTTAGTTYFLAHPTAPYTDNVTDFRTNITAGTAYFTYYSGYGGLGQAYTLGGLPTSLYFLEYYSSGTFQP